MKAIEAKYLIIGNSAGGIGAAEAIRTVDRTRSLLIVSDEPFPAYSRPLIAKYLAERCPVERLLFRPADFYQRNNISTLLGRKVERLDIGEHAVILDSGEKATWEKLLLATGGSPIVPDIEGIQREGIFTFTTLDDARAIDQFLNKYRKRTVRAVVIGGGLIGVSVTEALVRRGVEVIIVEMKERILNTILDEETSAMETEALKSIGVKVVTGHTVASIGSYLGGAATGVTLDDSRPIPCEVVIMAIGVRPCIELVLSTAIKTNRGIVVDRRMATSQLDVYACGDAAEAYDFVYGENRFTPIWPNAYLGGRVAGFNMAGVLTEYPGGTAMNSLNYFGLNIAAAGIVNPPDTSYEVLRHRTDHIYRKVVLKDSIVAGMIFVGSIEKSGIVFRLMRDKINVNEFKSALVADDFGLASLPDELRWRWLEMPPEGSISQVVSGSHPEEAFIGE